ncbi:DUF6318 family protein [Tersicoccus sp. MR15.9]|uniref:DUF6318 family protein n=1 Tax=Tersicoccus mangrovi TaxID=3121635 RepID=UPI002FE502F4
MSVSASPTPSTSATPTPDPRPTAGSAKGPARNLPKPTMPAAAKQKTEAGLKAYAAYWVAALSYAYETSDSSVVRDASSKKCVDCVALYDAFDRSIPSNGWGSGGKITGQMQLRDGFLPDVNGRYIVLVGLSQQPYSIFSSNGTLKARNPNVGEYILLLETSYSGGRWEVVNYDRLKG